MCPQNNLTLLALVRQTFLVKQNSEFKTALLRLKSDLSEVVQ